MVDGYELPSSGLRHTIVCVRVYVCTCGERNVDDDAEGSQPKPSVSLRRGAGQSPLVSSTHFLCVWNLSAV